jgi:excisionase family DNA binding protein
MEVWRNPDSMEHRRLLNMTEAAEYLGLSKLTLYEWVSQRKIEYVKVGRLVKFDGRQLDRWIKKQTIKALAV